MKFEPVFRMMVCSDIHYGESEKYPERFEYVGQERDQLEKCIAHAYSYADNNEYNRIDAFAAVGDFVTSGTEKEMQDFKATLDKTLHPETKIILTMASHEYFAEGVEAADEKLYRIFGKKPMERTEINGFQCVALSTDDRCQTGAAKQEWLKTELRKARDFDPQKPVFFFFHPQFQNTVYGSAVLWRTPAIYQTAMNYPQVIAFSGHSHAPLNDPRTVHQKYFTCFGTGAVINVLYCNADRIASRAKTTGVANYLIVEADAENRVRTLAIDGMSGKVLREWIVEKPYDPDTFVYTDERYLTAKKPSFPQDAVLSASYADGALTVSVSQASDGDERVPGYHFIVKNDEGLILKQFGIGSGYHLYDLPERSEYTIDFDAPAGEYTLECCAVSFFDKSSDKLRTAFKI